MVKIFRTQADHDKYFEVFPDSGGFIITPVTLEEYPNVLWSCCFKDNDRIEEYGLFPTVKRAYFFYIAWNNSEVFDIDYENDIEYMGD